MLADMNAFERTNPGAGDGDTERPGRVWPGVSVIMPVLNEERHLAEAVAGVMEQNYPGDLELVLALGPSRDRTDEIAHELAEADPRIRLVPNPAGMTPAALNSALGAAKYDIVVRVDGHGVLSENYVCTAVDLLEETGAANVGGIMHAEGRSDFEQAVACAYTSRFGLGGGRFHLGGTAGPADSVYLGAFRRDALENVGGFDEYFQRAQDWELNHRLRAAGETVWFTPDLVVGYRPRPDLPSLARQFLKTGQWRREVVRRYPDTANLRYLAAPIVTVGVTGGTVAGVAAALGAPGWLSAGWLAPGGYAAGVVAAGVVGGRELPARSRVWLPPVLATMHLAWGAGFLAGVRGRRKARPVRPARRAAT